MIGLFAPLQFVLDALHFAATNDGHSTGGKGWYSDLTPLTPAEQQRLDDERSEGLAAAVSAGLIASPFSDGAIELILANPGARIYLDQVAWDERNDEQDDA